LCRTVIGHHGCELCHECLSPITLFFVSLHKKIISEPDTIRDRDARPSERCTRSPREEDAAALNGVPAEFAQIGR